MKKPLLILSITLLPLTALASFAVPFMATSTTQGWLQPILISGVFPTIVGPNFIATSTTATSTFNGDVLPNKSIVVPLSNTEGIRFYNTADQVTNYEFWRLSDIGNTLTLKTSAAGSGTINRNILFSSGGTNLTVGSSGLTLDRSTASAGASFYNFTGTETHASSLFTGIKMTPTVTQSGSAGYTMIQINNTETSLGTGLKYFLQLGTSTNNNLFLVDNAGNASSSGYINASYIQATSTTATSTLAAGIQATYLNLNGILATSTASNGFNLVNGCYAISGTCITGGSGGSGTVTSVATNNGLTGGTITISGTLGLDISKLSTNALTSWNGSILSATGTPALTAGYFISTSTTASTFPYASTTMVSATTASSSFIFGGNLGACSGSNFLQWSVTGLFSCGTPAGGGTVTGTGNAGLLSAWTSSSNLTATGTPTAANYYATSTNASVLPYASTTLISVSGLGTSTFSGPVSLTSASTTATSTMSGINLPYGGCVAVNGVCLTSNSGTVTSVATNNGLTGGTITTSGTIGLNTAGLVTNNLTTWNGSNLVATGTPSLTVGYVIATSTTATSTYLAGIQATYLNLNGATATSTASNGFNLVNGCFAIQGVCISGGSGGGVSSVTGTWPIISSGGATPNLTWGGLSTSTAITVGQLPYWTEVNTFGSVATGTASCTSGASCTSFTVIGSSPSISATLGTSITPDELNSAIVSGGQIVGTNAAGTQFVATGTPSLTVGYLIATSTTATSTNAAGIQATYLSLTGVTATSTATNGFNLSGGCFSINGVCLTSSSGTVTSVATNNGLTGGTITTSGTVGLNTTGLVTNTLTTWNGSNLVATGTPALTAGYYIATTTTASILPYASTTMISATTASSSFIFGGNLASCSGSNFLQWTSTGLFSCAASSGSLSGGTAGMLTSWVTSTTVNATGTPTVTAIFATSTTATSTFLGGFTANNGNVSSDWNTGTTTISNLNMGNINFDVNAGTVTALDMPITSAATTGTVERYSFNLAASSTANAYIYGESNGSGGIQNQRVGVATSTPWRTLDINGTVGMKNLSTSGASQAGYLCLSSNNEVVNDSTTCLVSALRFKKQIQPIDAGIGEVMKLNPVNFYLKEPVSPNDKVQQFGFIADEVQKVDPRLVTLDNQGHVLSFRYENFTAILAKAVQDIFHSLSDTIVRITNLEHTVADQQKQIDSLQAQINALK